jgi:hypothetical protein
VSNRDVEAFERATRRSRTIKIALTLLVVGSPLLYVGYKNYAKRAQIAERREAYERAIALTDADRTELTAAIARTRKSIEDAAREFVNETTAAKLDALEDSGQPCHHGGLRGPTMGAGESYVKFGSIDLNYFGNARYRVVAPGTTVTPRVSGELATLDDIAKQLAENKADKNDLDRVRRMERSLDDDLFVVGEMKPATVLADTYLPGQLSGFAYLYSYGEGRVVCFSALAVQNSETVEIRYRTTTPGDPIDYNRSAAAREVLARDLEVQVRTAIAARLHAVL